MNTRMEKYAKLRESIRRENSKHLNSVDLLEDDVMDLYHLIDELKARVETLEEIILDTSEVCEEEEECCCHYKDKDKEVTKDPELNELFNDLIKSFELIYRK